MRKDKYERVFTDEELEAIIDYKSGKELSDEQKTIVTKAFEKHQKLKEDVEKHLSRRK